jgi:hypothetical protein
MGLYARLCERAAKLAKNGEPRRPTEGPRDYLARIAMNLPESERGRIERGFALYEELRYAHRTPSADGLAALRRCIQSLGT